MKIAKIRPKLFKVLKSGYKAADFTKDLSTGITVGVVALPLALAFAIASGADPEKGLITAVVAGFFISLLGGSRYQIGGPTGAFVIIVYGVIARHGYDGLVLATIMAGLMLLIFGFSGLGSYIKFIPYPVVAGFTAGIGVVLMTTELKDLFGFDIAELSPDFITKIAQYVYAAPSINLYTLGIGVLTVVTTVMMRKKVKSIPSHISAIIFVSVIVAVFNLPVETIGSKFGALPSTLPIPSLPAVSWERIVSLFPDALTIALLAGIESLLSAVIADGMSSDRHDSNTELVGQAVGNVFSGLFGGIPATGAIARTVTNIKMGARSPISGIVHAITLLLIMMFLSKIVVHIPMTAIAGILMVVSWDMVGIKTLIAFRKSHLTDTTVMLTALVLTVLVDITVAVQVGVVIAALIFMKRMSDTTSLETVMYKREEVQRYKDKDPDATSNKEVPAGVGVYEINGPFFFGVADKLIQTLEAISDMPKVFILRMRKVNSIDATGLQALHSFYGICKARGVVLVLSGVQLHGQVMKSLLRDGFIKLVGRPNVTKHIDVALNRANTILKELK